MSTSLLNTLHISWTSALDTCSNALSLCLSSIIPQAGRLLILFVDSSTQCLNMTLRCCRPQRFLKDTDCFRSPMNKSIVLMFLNVAVPVGCMTHPRRVIESPGCLPLVQAEPELVELVEYAGSHEWCRALRLPQSHVLDNSRNKSFLVPGLTYTQLTTTSLPLS